MYHIVLLSSKKVGRECLVCSSDGKPVAFRDLEIAKKVGESFKNKRYGGVMVKHYAIFEIQVDAEKTQD